MASQPKTTTQTTSTEPWSGSRSYLTDVYAQYDKALKEGKPETWSGPTVADQSDQTKLAQQMAASTALSSGGMLQNAQNANNNLVNTGGANQNAQQTYNTLMNGVNIGANPSSGGIASLIGQVANNQVPGSNVYGNVANGTNTGLAASQNALNSAQQADPTMANLNATASGANVGNNPWLQQNIQNNQQSIADMLSKQTIPGLSGQAAQLGRNGSGAFASQINDATSTAANAMSKVATDAYANQYNQDTANMLQANNQLSSAHNAGVQNQLNAANNLTNSYAQNANTQMAGAQGMGNNYQQSISNLSNLLGQQSDQYNQGVSNQLNNANLALNAANGGTAASNAAANTQLQAAQGAGNVYNNSLLPAETIGAIGQQQDAYNQEKLNGQIAQFDQNQQMPLIQLSNFANILNGGGYNQQTSQTTQPGNSALSNILGLGTGLMSLFTRCDRTTKENITFVGKSPNGWAMYSFNYIGDDEIYIGPMAQEVEEIAPEMVVEFDGVKHVNNDVFKEMSIH
ncbi:tail fiber domain-containing protein [Agrobacterium rubi]|uniref:tail fiber domain-containing protein n=1 Tax=Agrobacterium rubi TaxID=28099 RepID=UPI0015727DAB|nr:tail fiber domain-containing protein [Agrobacterium rubi]NTF06860.1 tail fiber domain-containing protein [Agrobacterium rubi]NTF19102.1 tail fiber domain-containing protein [Agrobacterium rubi]NTF26065.1 tail fiber domain-containing protein [Agrobacterium rubi]